MIFLLASSLEGVYHLRNRLRMYLWRWKICEILVGFVDGRCGPCIFFSKTFELAINKECVVSSQYRMCQDNRVWNIRFHDNFNESHQSDLNSLILVLNSYIWQVVDGFIWKWNSSREFFVKSYNRFLNNGV